jgi:osmotically-inducible protein OsmY
MIPAKLLQRNVLDELDWDPTVNAAQIGVTVEDGIITLTGTVDSYADKIAAERATKRVLGVQGIANDLHVKLPQHTQRSDTDIVKAVLNALEWDIRIPRDRITVTVKDAWVTLEGEVEWNFERDEAVRVVRPLKGVVGVSNLITVKPRVKSVDVRAKITEALKRNAEVDAQKVVVAVDGSKVTLSGTVRSFAERDDAEHAAWAAQGVAKVQNLIDVEPPQMLIGV